MIERKMSLIRRVSSEVSIELPEWFQHIEHTFECPICRDTILIPVVYQCDKGHNFCATCHKQLTSHSPSCPVCRDGRLNGIRNLLAEDILSKLPIKKCKFVNCIFVANMGDDERIAAHEEDCEHGRQTTCVECYNHVPLGNLTSHLRQMHDRNSISLRIGHPGAFWGNLENDCTGFQVLADLPDQEPELKVFFCSQILDNHYVLWMFHNLPRNNSGAYKFIISLESDNKNEQNEEEMNNYENSLMVFEGPVLQCEATAETVKENAQGMVVDMSFMRDILKYDGYYSDKGVYYCTVAIKMRQQ